MSTNQITFKRCNQCKKTLPTTEFYPHNRDVLRSECKACSKKHPERTSYKDLKSCSTYLGVHVAERVLANVFKDVNRMPLNYPGYDFICNHGKKIDVKSSCKTKTKQRWEFNTNKNTTADYFLCIAFDNRRSLTPLHLWLIPGKIINHQTKSTISLKTIHKWDAYTIDISKTIECCDAIKK